MSTKELQEIKFPENDVAEVKEKAAITIPKNATVKIIDAANDEEDEDEVFSCSYCDKEFDTEKGKRFHENVYCRSKSIGGGKSSGLRYNTCSRCGRVGHNASKCYARTDVDGDELDSNDEYDSE